MQKVRKIEIWIHLLIWILIFNLPLMSLNTDEAITWQRYLQSLRFPFTIALVFYINYLYFVPKFLLVRKISVFVIANLLLFAAFALLVETSRGPGNLPPRDMTQLPPRDFPNRRRPKPPSRPEMLVGVLLAFAMTTGAAVAIHTTSQWLSSEQKRKDLEREHLESELTNLKNQLNPHFFFNTLNNIYGLIIQNQDKAQQAVHTLSKLMRYLLYDSNEGFVPLSKEIEFLHNYIDLMKLRVTDTVTVVHEFPQDHAGLKIAPLLFISLIENSFKHGISPSKPSTVEIRMEILAGKKLKFTARNTSFPKSDNDRSGSGIGLENLRKRLMLLYPESHSLEIKSDELYYETILMIQL